MADKLELIADEIIGYSDGAFHIAWSESYEELTPEEQQKVADMVFDAIENCARCGWNFHIESMAYVGEDQHYCWRCYEDLEEEEEAESYED